MPQPCEMVQLYSDVNSCNGLHRRIYRKDSDGNSMPSGLGATRSRYKIISQMINPMFLSRNNELRSTASIRIKIESKPINNLYVVVEPFVSYFPCYSGQIPHKNKLKS